MTPVNTSLERFRELAKDGNVVPVCAQLAADFETPLSAFSKLVGQGAGFLLESAETKGDSGRYSIMGGEPKAVFMAKGKTISIVEGGETQFVEAEKDVLDELEKMMAKYRLADVDGDLPFYGGAVGFLAYDAVKQFEPSIELSPEDDLRLPETVFYIADRVLVFDHKLRRLTLVANAFVDEAESVEAAYKQACLEIQMMLNELDEPLHIAPLNGNIAYETPEAKSNTTQQEFENMVEQAKEYITAGDIFQVVPSQRFETKFGGAPIDLYRALRHVNPSPYMFILQLDGFSLVGSSPEVHVKAIHGKVEICPIAGTRWRGKTREEDDALAMDLLADEKERAEHLMLVDLARNDVGRIAQVGSVLVDDFMTVERYSHVMHIVSNVSGQLAEKFTAYDALRSTFPAGTVSGAPKIRAMQIINELEKNKRGTYSGAVGYFGWDGGHDSCITLRTCLLKDGKVYVQAGAGVVADSNATYEYQETVNKAMGMIRAVGLAKTLGNGQKA